MYDIIHVFDDVVHPSELSASCVYSLSGNFCELIRVGRTRSTLVLLGGHLCMPLCWPLCSFKLCEELGLLGPLELAFETPPLSALLVLALPFGGFLLGLAHTSLHTFSLGLGCLYLLASKLPLEL